MDWINKLPSTIATVDVETTGPTEENCVVSIGAPWLSTVSLLDGSLPVSYLHLIFNLRRKSPWAVRSDVNRR